jgi:hypothetical protein
MWQRLESAFVSVALTIFTLVLIPIAATPAYGHDSGTPFAEWMKSLKQPHQPTNSCCGMADQYYVSDYRPSQKPSMAFIALVLGNHGFPDFEIDVPHHTVMWNQPNPTGRGVIFIVTNEGNYQQVLCFVPETGT